MIIQEVKLELPVETETMRDFMRDLMDMKVEFRGKEYLVKGIDFDFRRRVQIELTLEETK